jgi:8-oxo-dGTP diphosphatase
MSEVSSPARPALTVDAVVFGLDEEGLKVLLIERGRPPYAGSWAIPGGFVVAGEHLEDAARRELEEETGLSGIYLEQLYTFGDPGRDPREHVVSVAWFALVNIRDHLESRGSDASDAAWFPVHDTPKLAFDHARILETALERLKGKVRYRPVGFELLPPKFSLGQLQHLYETILEQPLDKRNFRKKVLGLGLLVAQGEREKNVARRPAQLYCFDRTKYQQLERKGFEFRI